MDRRHFLNMFLAAPVFAPLLLAARKTAYSAELYLISDDPLESLPLLLAELSPSQSASIKTFSFITSHPRQQQLRAGLARLGWREENEPSRAHLTLSFNLLRHRARPSFTLIQDSQIKDVRSRKLRTLWDRMGQRATSTSLTTAGFRPEPPAKNMVKFASVYQDGTLRAKLPLNRTVQKTWQTRAGFLTVQVNQGHAKIVQSACRHQICQCTPPVSLSGERIICAPSHFFLEIQGATGLDTVIG